MSNSINLLLDYINVHNAPGGGVFKKIRKIFPDLCETIDNTMSGSCWTEKLYRYTHPDHKDTCKMCSVKMRYVNWERGFQTYCSQQCKNGDPEFKQKVKDTFVQNYGTDHPFKNADIQKKRKQTWQDNYGCDNPAKNAEVQGRMKATNLERYGVENIFEHKSPLYDQMREKAQATCFYRLGVTHAFSSPDIIEKRRQTWLKKYGETHPHKCQKVRDKYLTTVHQNWGVDHPMQVAEVLDKNVKNAKKSKKFVYPSGKVIMVQGHEPKALDILLKEGIKEDQILNLRVDMPSIWYIDTNGKKHRYYPDFYLPHLNLVIEVKSVYTSQMRPDLLELKKQATIDAGYQIRLMIL